MCNRQYQPNKKKIAVVCVYLPPSLKSLQLAKAIDAIIDHIDKIKVKFPDAIVMIGGDFNKKDITTVFTTFPELTPVKAGATRNGVALDEIYSNIPRCLKQKAVLRPLSKLDGTQSDH